MQNKYRNSLTVLQAQTGTNFPKARSFRFLICKYKSIGGSYLQITTGSDSADRTQGWYNLFFREISFRKDYPPVEALHIVTL
jgi:hypothetical protein